MSAIPLGDADVWDDSEIIDAYERAVAAHRRGDAPARGPEDAAEGEAEEEAEAAATGPEDRGATAGAPSLAAQLAPPAPSPATYTRRVRQRSEEAAAGGASGAGAHAYAPGGGWGPPWWGPPGPWWSPPARMTEQHGAIGTPAGWAQMAQGVTGAVGTAEVPRELLMAWFWAGFYAGRASAGASAAEA